MEYKNLNELAEIIHNINKEKGFWQGPRPFGDIVSLIHCELSEAFEEYRCKGKYPNKAIHYYSEINDKGGIDRFETNNAEFTRKPEGIVTEMMDVIIRVLDWCKSEGLDIDKLMSEKIAHNRKRPHRYGGKIT